MDQLEKDVLNLKESMDILASIVNEQQDSIDTLENFIEKCKFYYMLCNICGNCLRNGKHRFAKAETYGCKQPQRPSCATIYSISAVPL